MDFRDHRPDLNPRLLELLASGVGLRQSSRLLALSLRCCELKFRKLARHLRRLNLNLRFELPEGSSFQFDEFETYEGRRNTRPVTIAVLIERSSRFVVWAESAPIRPRGTMTRARLRAIEEDERRYGPRRDGSRSAVRRTLARGAALVPSQRLVLLESDAKQTYPALAKSAFGGARLVHRRFSSELARTISNPLFPINHTEAMLRDLSGRLRRDGWLVSKKRRYLDLGLQIVFAWKNLVRYRFNREHDSPAAKLGFVPRRLSEEELCSWRQDWAAESIHPLARQSESIAECRRRLQSMRAS